MKVVRMDSFKMKGDEHYRAELYIAGSWLSLPFPRAVVTPDERKVEHVVPLQGSPVDGRRYYRATFAQSEYLYVDKKPVGMKKVARLFPESPVSLGSNTVSYVLFDGREVTEAF